MYLFPGLVVITLLAWIYYWLSRQPLAGLTSEDPESLLVIGDEHVDDGIHDANEALRSFVADRSADVHVSRQRFDAFFEVPVASQIFPVSDCDNGIDVVGEWVIGEQSDPARRVLYLHGGGFRVGSPRSHRAITAAIASSAQAVVMALDYPMRPEHDFPCIVSNVRNAYRWMVETGPEACKGQPAEFVAVAGDSAGGNLAVALTHWIRDTNGHRPDAAVAISPLLDWSLSGQSFRDNAASDLFLGPVFAPLLRLPRPIMVGLAALGNRVSPWNPAYSPLFGNLADLPPLLIQASRDEMLLSDALRYRARALQQGSPVEVELWPQMPHVFQAFPRLPESKMALDRIGQFLMSASGG